MKKGFTTFSLHKCGFTVVEILVVVGVLTVVSVIFVEIFSRSLRGGHQAQALGVIKQNGQQAMEIMDKNIKLADNIVCIDNNTLVIVKEGVYTRFTFIPPSSSRNGYISQDNSSDCTSPTIPTSLTTLTNTDPTSGVSVMGGSFTKDTKPGFKDIITIKFSVDLGVGVPKNLTDNVDPLEFNTTVELR